LTTEPELLGQRGGAFYSEAAVGLIASLLADQPGVHSANVRNRGTFAFLPDEAVIEVSCDVTAAGPAPRPVGRVAPDMAGLIAAVSGYEELAVEAALLGGRERVYHALLAHPLIGQYDLAEKLTDLLIAENRAHLAWTK